MMHQKLTANFPTKSRNVALQGDALELLRSLSVDQTDANAVSAFAGRAVARVRGSYGLTAASSRSTAASEPPLAALNQGQEQGARIADARVLTRRVGLHPVYLPMQKILKRCDLFSRFLVLLRSLSRFLSVLVLGGSATADGIEVVVGQFANGGLGLGVDADHGLLLDDGAGDHAPSGSLGP
jgi:hypothetical protein